MIHLQQLFNSPTHNTPHHSPHQGSSHMNIVQHVSSTQSQQTVLRTQPYTPAQTYNIQPSTTNTIYTNPDNHPTTSRTLCRPSIPLIPNYPLSYNLSSTNNNNCQQPPIMSQPQSNTLQMNSVSTSQIPEILSTTK